jgi:hypothetical protein
MPAFEVARQRYLPNDMYGNEASVVFVGPDADWSGHSRQAFFSALAISIFN